MYAVTTISAPTGGWNSTYPVTNLAQNEAITLDNLIPDTGFVSNRLGYQTYCDLSADINTIASLFEFRAAAMNKFVAAGEGKFYDITDAQAPVEIGTGFTNDYWNGTVFLDQAGAGGLILVNGEDAPQYWTGLGDVQALGVTGHATVSNLIDCVNFKNHVWFVEKNSQNPWYSPFDSIVGAALTKFYLSGLGSFGGNLQTIKTFTADGGSGRQEFIAFYMTSGEIIIYQGADPSDAADFILVGVYRSGRPIPTARGVCKFGADLVAITDSGYLPLSSLLSYSFGKSNDQLGEKIRGAALAAVNANFVGTNWQIILVQNYGLLLINVPTTTGGIINQHVLNVNTMAWSSFSGMPANVWCMFGNNLYFGDNTGVIWQYSGNLDGADQEGSGGAPITCTYTSPYLFNQPSGLLQSTAFRPRVLLGGNTTIFISSSADFQPYSPPYQINLSSTGIQWAAAAVVTPGPAGPPFVANDFGINDPSYIPVSLDPIPWGRAAQAPYTPGPANLLYPLGDQRNLVYYGPDDPGAVPMGEIGWAQSSSNSLSFLNLSKVFYSLSIKLQFVVYDSINFYETDFLIKKAVRI